MPVMTTRFFGSFSRLGAETAALMWGRMRRRGLRAVVEGALVADLGRKGSSGEARRGGDWRDCMAARKTEWAEAMITRRREGDEMR